MQLPGTATGWARRARTLAALGAAGLLAAALHACKDSTSPPPPPAHIAAVAGTDAQSATVATAVPIAPSVLVTDEKGNPMGGVRVTFQAASGGGSVKGATQRTNRDGIATAGG